MILTAYADAGIPFDVANGASPGDVVRLAETGGIRGGGNTARRRAAGRVNVEKSFVSCRQKPCGTGFLCSARSLQAGPKALLSAWPPRIAHGSASIASRNTPADSASFTAEAAIRGDTNGPDVPSW